MFMQTRTKKCQTLPSRHISIDLGSINMRRSTLLAEDSPRNTLLQVQFKTESVEMEIRNY